MSLIDLIPPTGCNLTYLVQLADRWPSDLRRELDALTDAGRLTRINIDGVAFWRPVEIIEDSTGKCDCSCCQRKEG